MTPGKWVGICVLCGAWGWGNLVRGEEEWVIHLPAEDPAPVEEKEESGRRFLEKIVNLTERRQANPKYDTTYIERYENTWTLKAKGNFSGWGVRLKGVQPSGEKYDTHLSAQNRITTGIGVAYRRLGLALMVNPAKLKGEKSDGELDLTICGNKFGIDLTYRMAKNFEGTTTLKDTTYDVRESLQRMTYFEASMYWAFNHKRFSYPAAFNQTYRQKKSCGSWIVGGTLLINRFHIAGDEEIGLARMKIHIADISLGGGYAYNFVIRESLLIHLSAMPSVVVAYFNNVRINGEKEERHFTWPDGMMNTRMAVVYTFGRWFVGGLGTMNQLATVNHTSFRLYSSKWRARLFVGVRI